VCFAPGSGQGLDRDARSAARRGRRRAGCSCPASKRVSTGRFRPDTRAATVSLNRRPAPTVRRNGEPRGVRCLKASRAARWVALPAQSTSVHSERQAHQRRARRMGPAGSAPAEWTSTVVPERVRDILCRSAVQTMTGGFGRRRRDRRQVWPCSQGRTAILDRLRLLRWAGSRARRLNESRRSNEARRTPDSPARRCARQTSCGFARRCEWCSRRSG